MISEVELIIRLIFSFILSMIIGFEREISLKPAGLRTHVLVSIASTLFTILSLYAFPEAETSRLAASVLVGIGFIGAGTIIKTKQKIIGLTTAATLWTVTSIGIAVGAGYYLLASIVSVLTFLVLKLGRLEKEST